MEHLKRRCYKTFYSDARKLEKSDGLTKWVKNQCWTEGRSSMAVAEDLGPMATAMVAEVLGHIYSRRFYWKFS